jgi:hypothetical protein
VPAVPEPVAAVASGPRVFDGLVEAA